MYSVNVDERIAGRGLRGRAIEGKGKEIIRQWWVRGRTDAKMKNLEGPNPGITGMVKKIWGLLRMSIERLPGKKRG